LVNARIPHKRNSQLTTFIGAKRDCFNIALQQILNIDISFEDYKVARNQPLAGDNVLQATTWIRQTAVVLATGRAGPNGTALQRTDGLRRRS